MNIGGGKDTGFETFGRILGELVRRFKRQTVAEGYTDQTGFR